MRNIKLNNQRLAAQLSSITDFVFSDEITAVVNTTKALEDKLIPDLYSCSTEYLYEAFKHPIHEYGFPRSALGCGMRETPPHLYDKLLPASKMCDRVGRFLGTPNNALMMVYPDNGYIGWHHNGNASGYNVLMTYSQDGDGWFDYYDYDTKSTVRLQDQPGWNVRVGYYPCERREPKRVFWHMAETKKQRITFAWVINHKDMWKNMIEEITDGDYDPAILEQGPLV